MQVSVIGLVGDAHRSPGQFPSVPFMASDFPQGFVQRPREFEQLIAELAQEKRDTPIAISTALQGAGGYGKTTLAVALCHRLDF